MSMINTQEYKIFKDNISTLKETSKDNHDGRCHYMTGSEEEVINFDGVKEDYISDLGLKYIPGSVDAMLVNSEGAVFIEFKNGRIKSSTVHNIEKKIYDSIAIFTDITRHTLSYTRNCCDLILVYNYEKNKEPEGTDKRTVYRESESKDTLSKMIMEMGKESYIKFGLEKFQGYFFRNVYTYSKGEFEEEFLDGI